MSRYVICSVFLFLCLPVGSRADDFKDKQTGLVFPEDLGRFFTRVDAKEYDDSKLGVYIGYNLGTIARASIYLYHAGVKDIGAGIRSEQVPRHFKQVKGDIFEMEKQGHYRSVRLVSETEESVKTASGDLTFLRAYFTYKEASPKPRGTEPPLMHSDLYLTGYKNLFLKVRFSYSEEHKEAGKAAKKEFFDDLGKLLK